MPDTLGKVSKPVVLVTGAYGFLGRHTALEFSRSGAHIIGLGHGMWPESEWRAWGLSKWHSGAVTVENILDHGDNPDWIIHCAGGGSVGFSVSNPLLDFQRTVGGTSEVLEFIRKYAPGAGLVYPSSAAVYGCARTVPISEEDNTAPVSPYGVHKQMAEQLCRSYGNSFGVKCAILRLFSVYGPGLRKQLLWDACHKLQTGEPCFGGTGLEKRDWLHVADASKLLRLAAERVAPDCPTVNGASGEGVEVREILSEVNAGLNLDVVCQFTGVGRPGDPLHLVANVSKAMDWGWRPEISWGKGVKEYAEWFRSQL